MTKIEKGKDFFGYRIFIVLSDSMRGVFDVGDAVVSKAADTSALKAGDVITFKSIDPENYGAVVTHKIEGRTEYEGSTAFITYGVATGSADAFPVPEENVLGKYAFRVPKAGFAFDFLKSSAGYVLLILLPFSVLLLFEGAHFFSLLKRYKGNQQLMIDKQQEELAEEKKKTEEMAKELERMRETLGYRQKYRSAADWYTKEISVEEEADANETPGESDS